MKKKIVVFFDTTFEEGDENRFLEYLELIDDFCKMRPDAIALLKSKKDEIPYDLMITPPFLSKFYEIWLRLLGRDNFRCPSMLLEPLPLEKIKEVCDNLERFASKDCSMNITIHYHRLFMRSFDYLREV